MEYIEIRISTSDAGIEIVNAGLMELGFVNIMIEDPRDAEERIAHADATEYLDEETRLRELGKKPQVVLYLEKDGSEEAGVARVNEAMAQIQRDAAAGVYGSEFDPGSLAVSTDARNDEEWKDRWKAFFKPARVSRRFIVRPPWEDCQPEKEDDFVISIDPGMAFGTGLHETSSLCMKMLEDYVKPGDKVLDVGCGTGILSIVAAKLGAGEVLGTDIDENAVTVSQTNFDENGVDNARALLGDLTKGIDFEADVVVANLLTNLVIMLTGSVAKHVRKDGLYISSGILDDHSDRVKACLEENGFEVIDYRVDGEWCSIAARRLN